jgi:F-type H+-transporting ATPase subunit c
MNSFRWQQVFGGLGLLLGCLVAADAYASDGSGEQAKAFLSLGATLGLGLAAMGGALGQAKAAAAAFEGIARNPSARDKIFTPFMISLVLIESLVIYALVIALLKL